jgi:hypothetical protein
MKRVLGYWLLALVVATGCSVDVSKLKASSQPNLDAAREAGKDREPSDEPMGSGDDGGPPPDLDVAAPPEDADAREEDGDGDDTPDGAPDTSASGALDLANGNDADATPDLPPQAPDLSPEAPDLPADAFDLPPPALDLAAEAPAPDAAEDSPPSSDGDVADDLVPPGDGPAESGGRSNGSSCTTPDQCQSGFCLGTPGRCCSQSCESACYRSNQCSMTGACVPTFGAITCGDLDALCALSVRDLANAREWSLQTDLQVGDQAQGSDPHAISAVPAELAGSPWIRPSRLSKSVTTNPLVTFTLSAPADVYVGIDVRLAAPTWMSGWTDSGLTISYLVISTTEPNTTVTQRLYQAHFPAGEVALGPLACTAASNCSMYLTVIRFADQPSGTIPSCR